MKIIKKYKRALVTGGAGFIGSHISKRLVELGLEVVAIDDLSMGKEVNVPKPAKLIVRDILDYKALDKAMKGVDIVFHQAAKVSIRNSMSNFYGDARTNIMGTVNVIKAVIENKVKKLIYASSMAVYGNAEYLPIDEKHPLNPISPYGISKLASEKYCLEMARHFGFDAVALRYFNTYGARQAFTPYVGVITIFINRLLKGLSPVIFGSGRQVRDFVSVEDVAEANILAISKKVSGQVYNVGSGNGRSVNDIARLLIQTINPKIKAKYGPHQPGEPSSSIANIAKAKKELGFIPRFTIEDKIIEIINWNEGKKV